ncbi:epoxyqueuosine reductase QueH [Peptoniphilus porci]|uniref:Epoxyqueuosine reductase QueH n=1 Tax=Peptoniphilus porci TaxID=2652280 RepID=A0A1U7LY25_9FIRM|nr:epoxyqueuosine reductase QueH [Peptoniphilus porci]OLR64332.1 recombinase [Peptoniphilus porci]
MKKINYNLEMEKIIEKIEIGKEPRLLLHSCCGPCSSAVLERICDYFDIDVFYYNPNIDSEDEFYRRSNEQIKLVEDLGLNEKIDVKVIKYNHNEFLNYIKGFENYKEGGARCFKCYKQRLEKTAKYAAKNNYDYFTTTLSISPHKDSQILNRLGKFIAEEYQVKYLYSDFKKKNGFKRSVELTDKFNMYRQDYCGCEFSRGED